MTEITPCSPIKLPSAYERQQIFYWLQQISSVTAWRRILSYFDAWALATKNSLLVAEEQGWADKTSLSHSEYTLILKCLAHCETGVLRLSKGDKRVFKFDANGEFAMAERMLTHWAEMRSRIEIGESRVNPYVPLWEPFCKALDALSGAWSECAPDVLESRFLEDAAPTVYGQVLVRILQTTPFPPTLQSLPDPLDNTFVRTGRAVPCSGIWEPINVAKVEKTGMRSIFMPATNPQAPFEIAGTMNYLHGGSNAPQVALVTADDFLEIDITWRLLWRDDRYQDGSVPAIESGYRFIESPADLPHD